MPAKKVSSGESAPEKADKAKIERIDIERLMANDYNPNVMDAVKLDALSEDVIEQGMDQPIVVIRHPQDATRYVIVDGEHRWRAARAAGETEILVSVKDWSSQEAKVQTVRRNILRGELDARKFSNLVRDVSRESDKEINQIRKEMGFVSEKEFARLYKDEGAAEKLTDGMMQALVDEVQEKDSAVGLVSEIVREVILKHGETIGIGLIFFSYRGAQVLALDTNKEQMELLKEMVTLVKDANMSKKEFAERMTVQLAALTGVMEAKLDEVLED